MKKYKKNDNPLKIWITIAVVGIFLLGLISEMDLDFNFDYSYVNEDEIFRIISSTSTSKLDEEIINYGEEIGIDVEIEHYGDLEIVDILNEDSTRYDAVWISNSIWLYMLENSYLVTDSKSIVINPVVMGIEKSKAEALGFVNKDVYNQDLLNAIKEGKLKYIMSSVTKTNTGATAYLSFLNNMAGSPEVLTEEMLKDEKLAEDLKAFFKGVQRVSGDEEYLTDMFFNGDYNAMINYENTLIEINKKLTSLGKEPLYLIYPTDGVAINDMPFAYISNDSSNTKNREDFLKIQSYLRSDKMIKKMQDEGFRSWYGGVNPNVNQSTFNKDWGIDTTKYLNDMKYPSKTVITKALNLYIEALRKPTHVVFCLDVSGSMSGDGMEELKEAMTYILDYEEASKDNLQFSEKDKISIVTFNDEVARVYKTRFGSQTQEVITDIQYLRASGGTNIYDPTIAALNILKYETNDEEYTKTVILMTDGESNDGSFYDVQKYYHMNKETTPIYSITFGYSDERQLRQLAELSNAKVFDGKSGLKEAFAEVRSYN
jgi:Ca-activated chloride channel family protein